MTLDVTGDTDPTVLGDRIGFERLVADTVAQITSKPSLSKLGIDQALVREVLASHHIAERISSTTEAAPAKRLVLRRLVIRGNKRPTGAANSADFVYDRSFKPGLNGWISGNNTGKSTILKCISWALTGTNPGLKRDVGSWIDEVSLELSIDDIVYTVRYFVRSGKPNVYGHIYEGAIGVGSERLEGLRTVGEFVDSPAMKDEIARFFSTRLGFTPLDWVQQKKNAFDLTRSIISWNVFSQALVLSADDYGDFLFPSYLYFNNYHESTLSTFLGLGMEEAIAKLQAELTEAASRLTFEARRLEVNAEGVQERLQQLQIEEDQIRARIERLDAGRSVLIDPEYISAVRARIAAVMQKVVELSEAEHVLLEEEQSLQHDLTASRRARKQLEEAKEFRVFLSGIDVERCPHCEQAISAVPVDEEIRSGHCHVCSRELQMSSRTDQLESLIKIEKEREAKLAADMKSLRQDIRQADKTRAEAEADLAALRAELRDLPRQEQVGYDAEMRELLKKQGFLRGQIANLQEHTTEKAKEKLQRLKVEERILSATLAQLRGSVGERNRKILNRLDDLTTRLTLSFGLSGVDRVQLTSQFNLGLSQDGKGTRFAKMELSERLRLKIAFHLAMLILRISDQVGRHPGLLIVDAPGGAEMDEVRFGEILLGFEEVREELGNEVQILIASTREELERICPAESLEKRGENEFLF